MTKVELIGGFSATNRREKQENVRHIAFSGKKGAVSLRFSANSSKFSTNVYFLVCFLGSVL